VKLVKITVKVLSTSPKIYQAMESERRNMTMGMLELASGDATDHLKDCFHYGSKGYLYLFLDPRCSHRPQWTLHRVYSFFSFLMFSMTYARFLSFSSWSRFIISSMGVIRV